MTTLVADLVDQHQSLPVRLLQVANYLMHRREYRGHRKPETSEATAFASSSSLPIPDVVQARVADRPALSDVVELLAVVGEDGVESLTSRIGEEVQILLALPFEFIDVYDLVPGQDSSKERQQRRWNVFVQ